MQAQVVDGTHAHKRNVGVSTRNAVHESATVVAPVLSHRVSVARRADRLALAVRLDAALAAHVFEVRECDGWRCEVSRKFRFRLSRNGERDVLKLVANIEPLILRQSVQ